MLPKYAYGKCSMFQQCPNMNITTAYNPASERKTKNIVSFFYIAICILKLEHKGPPPVWAQNYYDFFFLYLF